MLLAASVYARPLTVSVPAGLDTTQIDPRLAAFGLYASQSLKLNDGVRVDPWRMGSGGSLDLGVGAYIRANAFVMGDFRSRSSSGIFGDVRLGGQYVPQAGAVVPGALVPDASMQPMRLALDPLELDANGSLFVEGGTQSVLYDSEAYPRDVTVRYKGTLVLVGTSFQFRSLVLNSGSKLVLRRPVVGASTAMTISVANELLVDGVAMAGTMDAASSIGVGLDGRAVLWRYHGSSELHMNGMTRFLGTLVAPNSKVSLASMAGFRGSLWAREIEIHQYNQNVAFLPYVGDSRTADTDVDGLDDTLEFRLGTDPLLVDTDGDGYTDGLEVLGRQGLMGAIKGVTRTPSRFAHSWGWALDTTRRDLFNPLRRDLFLRLVWQSDAEIRQMIGAMEMKWDTLISKKSCTLVPKYPSLFRGEFTEAWADSAWLDRLVEIFADPSDKPLVESPQSSRVADYTFTLHVDAGTNAWRNLDAGLVKFGGEVIVAAGGSNTGFGPYSFDLNGDGRLDNFASNDATLIDCQGNEQLAPFQNERDTLIVRMFRGWHADPFRDSWILGVGYGANGVGTKDVGTSEAPHHAFMTSTTSRSAIGLRGGLLHEYAHTLGPSDLSPIHNILQDGLLNYAFEGSMFQRCNPVRGATYADTRYCGDEPLPDGLGLHNSFNGEDLARFNVNWIDTSGNWLYNNPPTKSTDTLLYFDGGPLDTRTGFRKVRGTRTNADLRYSRGIYCSLDLGALNERTGISVCADSHGTALATPIPGTPIDWNQNGIIDSGLVDLWGNNNGGDWFINPSRKGWFPSSYYRRHRDSNDWVKIILKSQPFIGAGGNKKVFVVREEDNRQDLKGITKW